METITLPILEKFVSIQGEGTMAGMPMAFIRVAGCDLHCSFCDTPKSWKASNGQRESIDEIFEWVKTTGCRWVSITGGEPLLYAHQVKKLISRLTINLFLVQVETGGHRYDSALHYACNVLSIDAKTPCTGVENINHVEKWCEWLREQDQVKCLIRNNVDLDYAFRVNQLIGGRCEMILQPFNINVGENIDKLEHILLDQYLLLVTKFMKDKREWLKTRVLPQLHVMIYGNESGK